MQGIPFLAMVFCGTSVASVCGAADAKWIAVSALETGTSQNCGNGQSDWQVDIQGAQLKYSLIGINRSYTLDLKALQADGSGKVTGKDDKNREFYLRFEPGSGPRVFHVTNANNACAYAMRPKK
jgi:hypothetical protein